MCVCVCANVLVCMCEHHERHCIALFPLNNGVYPHTYGPITFHSNNKYLPHKSTLCDIPLRQWQHTCTLKNTHVHTRTPAHTCTHLKAHTCTFKHTRVHTRTRTRTHTCTHLKAHTCTHTHTHTHTPSSSSPATAFPASDSGPGPTMPPLFSIQLQVK